MSKLTAILKNKKTGESREVSVSLKTLEKDEWEGVSRCIGPCKCRIETDGECPQGWPARFEVIWSAK
ncbi:MAG: hypothetical protein MN733_39720 [Nitrososphaera sp.]|nr:hypothetical protein [Nitrososphaera sp.]